MLERSVGIKTMYLHMYTAVIAHVCAVHCTYMHGEDITQGVPKTHMAIKRKGDGEIVSSSGLSFPFSFSFSLLPPSPPAEKGGEKGKLLFSLLSSSHFCLCCSRHLFEMERRQKEETMLLMCLSFVPYLCTISFILHFTRPFSYLSYSRVECRKRKRNAFFSPRRFPTLIRLLQAVNQIMLENGAIPLTRVPLVRA